MTDCCAIDLTAGPVAPVVLDLSLDPIELTVAVDAIQLEVNPSPIQLDVNPQPIVLEITGVGVQGPPGGGSTNFQANNKSVGTVLAGSPVTTHSSGIGVIPADATTSGHAAVGLMSANTAPTAVGAVQTSGPLYLDDWTLITGASTLQAKAVYYLGRDPGTLTTSSPTNNPDISQRIGVAVSPNILNIDIWQYIQL